MQLAKNQYKYTNIKLAQTTGKSNPKSRNDLSYEQTRNRFQTLSTASTRETQNHVAQKEPLRSSSLMVNPALQNPPLNHVHHQFHIYMSKYCSLLGLRRVKAVAAPLQYIYKRLDLPSKHSILKLATRTVLKGHRNLLPLFQSLLNKDCGRQDHTEHTAFAHVPNY